MNSTPQSEFDTSLREALGQWVVDTPLPPRFQEHVWQRIARQQRVAPPNLRSVLLHWIEAMLPKPKLAFAYLTALLAAGGVAGSLAAQRENSRMGAALGSRYLQSVDPFQIAAAER